MTNLQTECLINSRLWPNVESSGHGRMSYCDNDNYVKSCVDHHKSASTSCAPIKRRTILSHHLLNRITRLMHPQCLLYICLTVTLIVTITTTNAQHDVMPQQYQHNNILYFSIEENKPNGTYIGTIRSSDGQVPYLVVPSPQTPELELKSAFSINFTSGDLISNAPLDREHREQYIFIAIVREPFAEIKCTVTVKDANDNAPMFLTSASNDTNFVIDIPEGQRGVRKMLPLAVDFDTPQYGIKEFRIISGNTPSGTFHLVEHEAPARSTLLQNGNLGSPADDTAAAMLAAGADNPQLIQQLTQQATVLIPSQPMMQTVMAQQQSTSPNTGGSNGASSSGSTQQVATQSKFLIDLEVSQSLDRENQSSYQLVIEAIDGGQPPQFGRLLVTVNVQDINDNDPIFLRKFYECHISEDTPKGALVQRVQAYDVDLDSNGQVSYYIKRHISSSQQIYPTNSSESNNEVASKFGASSSTTNSNNNNKQRQQNLASQQSSTQGKSTLNQRTVNIDGLNSQETTFSYNSKTRAAHYPEQLFDIDSSKGEIYLANQLDFETDQSHELLIEARDHGKPARSSYTTIKIHVIDVHDDPPVLSRAVDDRRAQSESRAESSARSSGSDFMEPVLSPSFNLSTVNFSNWFTQMNSSMLFAIIFVALVAVAFSVCLVKIKSRQPESEYNDNAALTLTSNNGQTKPSPNHSSSNLESPNGIMGDNMIHRHHDHPRRPNGSFAGIKGSGSFGIPHGKFSRYQYSDSSNLYHNPYPLQQRPRHHSSTSHHMPPDSPADHQVSGHVQGGSRGGTMALLNNHHNLLGGHTPTGHHHLLDHHHHHPFSAAMHGTSSLTYAHHHSRATLLQHSHHHQSSHQLSSVQQMMGGLSKGGTTNSIGTQHSAHLQSGSPMPPASNTTHSSGLPQNVQDALHLSHHNSLMPSIPQSHQVCQLPPTPTHNVSHGDVFSWPPQGHDSASGCYPGLSGTMHKTPGSTLDSCSTPAGATTPQPLDRWFDIGDVPQLINAQDWCSSYNWDYLEDWTPEYHTLMPMIETNGIDLAN